MNTVTHDLTLAQVRAIQRIVGQVHGGPGTSRNNNAATATIQALLDAGLIVAATSASWLGDCWAPRWVPTVNAKPYA